MMFQGNEPGKKARPAFGADAAAQAIIDPFRYRALHFVVWPIDFW